MAIQLKRSGRENFRIFERASEVGGVWRDNTCPGCECDEAEQLWKVRTTEGVWNARVLVAANGPQRPQFGSLAPVHSRF
ncbi:MAG: hypothetical protein H7222_08470 [Methylotenera sp.]|nr:hypothetical protein [Oligoflexia bacterium]